VTLLRALAALVLVVTMTGAAPVLGSATAAAPEKDPAPRAYAPTHRPGPALRVPKADLRAAMECGGNPRRGPHPVFLNPATSVTPDENYSWNWENVFADQGRYWCTMEMPFHTFGDIQTAAEYIVFAIRTMYRRTDRKITILGHSQGGMSGRWALRFWPDLRTKVAEVIGMAPSNHGTKVLQQCITGLTRCVPAVWQQGHQAAFVKALNSRAETFRGISYTNIYTGLDEVVRPPTSSGLTTGKGRISNIQVQELCPLDPYEHVLMGTVSPAVYGLVMDALRHRGPAKVSRVDRAICLTLVMPGVDPTDLKDNAAPILALPTLISTALPSVSLAGAPLLPREPRLRCYVYRDGCR
jgi:hypothetical protein